jgi:hypothetical protein
MDPIIQSFQELFGGTSKVCSPQESLEVRKSIKEATTSSVVVENRKTMWDSLSMAAFYVDLSREGTFKSNSSAKVSSVFLVSPTKWPTLKEIENSLGLSCGGIVCLSTTGFNRLVNYYCEDRYLEILESNLASHDQPDYQC